jgi:N-acetylmuramoyl-L-alanine amidase
MTRQAEQQHTPSAQRRRQLAAAAATIAILAAGCGAAATDTADERVATPSGLAASTEDQQPSTPQADTAVRDEGTSSGRPDQLAMATERPASAPPTTASLPIGFGDVNNPFVELPEATEARAVMTDAGVIYPVIDEREDSWLVSTVCQNIRFVSDATPIGRAHVVLDPGHGGREVGAASPDGVREADLNLQVAKRAAELLTDAGATVVLTRTGDYTVTAAARGHIAKAIEPALLVSVHHNGGAPATDDRPGTLVYTKTDSPESDRFGGIFYQAMQPMLTGAAEPKQEAYRVYAEALDAYEAQITAHDISAAARDAALVANGQLPPEAAITVPPPTTVAAGDIRLPRQRQLPTTTTLPITAAETVPVPDSLPLPEPLTLEPVREFKWAGAGNAGVRSWTRADGKDYLAVLRHSGDVPAALAEFLFVTNPSEAELLADPEFIEKEAGVLVDAIILYFTTDAEGTGFVQDQFDDQPIGGSGSIASCREP